MSTRVVMYDGSLNHIEAKLSALGLDLEIIPFGADGLLNVNGTRTKPEDVTAGFMWFSQHVKRDGHLGMAFDIACKLQGLKVVQTFNAGLDNPGYARLAKAGITICNSSAQGIAIAEYVIGQVLSVFQPIAEQRQMQVAREWRTTPHREISRTNWLIIGYGPIGSALAHRIKAFGAGVSVIRRSPIAEGPVDRAGIAEDLPHLLPEADVIVIACPLNDTTRHMVNDSFLSQVKPGAVLVNVARGGLVEDAALIKALDQERLSTAILDVFHTEPLPQDDLLWNHPKVRITPHTSFAGDGVLDRWDQLFLDNIDRFARCAPLERVFDPAEL